MKTPFLFLFLHAVRKFAGFRYPRLGPLSGFVRTLAPPRLDVELFDGVRVRLDLADETQFQTYWYGTRFEEPTGARMREWWDGATHFFDIGANYGFYSLWAASRVKSLKIHAFEPNPLTFARLDAFARDNNLAAIVRNPFALSDCETSFTLQLDEENTGASHSIESPATTTGSAVAEVRALPFDIYAADLDLRPGSSVAKIDVEGMELRVLRGMRDALTRKIFRGLCVELLEEHLQRSGTSVAEVDAFLCEHGYRQNAFRAESSSRKPARHHNGFYVPA